MHISFGKNSLFAIDGCDTVVLFPLVGVGLWWCLCKSFPLATMGKIGLRCGQVDGMEWGGEATGSRLLANTIWSAFHVLVLPLSSWRIVESRRIEHLECYRWCRWKARECATWMDALIRRVRFVRGVCARFAQRIRCLYLMRLQGGHVHFVIHVSWQFTI